MLRDPVFWHALSTRCGGPSPRSSLQFALGLGLALLLERALPRPQAGAGPGVPALGGAELHLRPRLGLAVQPDHRPAAALAVRAGVLATPDNILADPAIAMWGPITANVWWGVPFFAITLLAAIQAIPARCTRRRRSTAPAPGTVPPRHPALPGAHHRHHRAAAHDLDLQLRRSDRGDDRRRPGQHDPDPAQLHLHHAYKKLDFGYAATLSMALLLLLFLYSAVLIRLRRNLKSTT